MNKKIFITLALIGILAVPALIRAADAPGKHCLQGKVPPCFAQEYDADHDGKLSDEEEKKAQDAFMKQYDADKDGKISKDEILAFRTDQHKKFFDKADANKDGMLSREEFNAGMEKCPGRFGEPKECTPKHGSCFFSKMMSCWK